MVGLDLLGSLLPMAGAGASGFLEGQQQAIAANQAKQEMYLREQEEKRKQALFPKQLRSLDNEAAKFAQDFEFDEKMNPYEIERARLSTRPNVPGLNPDVAESLGVKDPNLVGDATFMEQLGILGDAQNRSAGITKSRISRTPMPSNDPTKYLRHLQTQRRQAQLKPPRNLQEVIPTMDPEMRKAMQNEAWRGVNDYLAYLDRAIANEESRLGMNNGPITPPVEQEDAFERAVMQKWGIE